MGFKITGPLKIQKLLIMAVIVLMSLLLHTGSKVSAATYSVTNTNDSGPGSFRQAILDANSNPGSDTINFSIPVNCPHIIPTSPLPPINSTVASPAIIDATGQTCNVGGANSPKIELSGNGAGAGARGLYITGNAAGSSVRGLVINRFGGQGIFIDTNNVTIVGNYIGTTLDGTASAGNGGDGVAIFSGTNAATANNNIIGGTTLADRNIISGNSQNGVGLTTQNGGTVSNNKVEGNYIGTDVTGSYAIGNGGDGVLLNHPAGTAVATGNLFGDLTGTTPGGACTGACNLISGNVANGLGLWHNGTSNSTVSGNYIGTNAAGTGAIANGNIGVEVNETPNNTVGGTTPNARNILSGNGGAGVFLTGASSTGNIVAGNYIGTNSAGTFGIGNKKMGIGIGSSPGAVGANSNTIGGTTGTTPGTACTGACNLISGNGQNGIFMTGSECGGHIIVGNYIGINAQGAAAIGNASDGIGILNTPNTQIGNGTTAGKNIIGSNGSNGIIVVGGGSTGNRIDLNTVGYSGFGNTASGVATSYAINTAILRNSIYANGILGIDRNNNGSVDQNTLNGASNFPNVYAARTKAGVSKIGGQFNSSPNSSFQVDFFYSTGCNGSIPQNYGQGQNYIGSTSVATDQFGNTAFGYNPASPIPGNQYVTATATRKVNGTPADTSEFSKCVLVNVTKPALTNGANWYLKDYLTTGPADNTFGYGFPASLLMCAWDPNQPGVKLPVVFSLGTWYMRASYTTGSADLTFSFGSSDSKPVCGDWDGDGVETIGVVSPGGIWSLRNTNSSGAVDYPAFQFGGTPSMPVVGDWTGSGFTKIGIVDSNNNWSLRNSLNSGPADASFNFGYTPGYPIVGDWDGNGTDTVGTVSNGGSWALRNSNSSGPPDVSFQYGFPGTIPITW
ncbi:MAG: hypothetical protein NVS1B7_1500 [Candidatus Saccharimonadales bacterium]